MLNLQNKVTVITGGSRGIGAACARLFAKQGSDIVFNYHQDRDSAAEVAKAVEKRGKRCVIVQGDIIQQKTAKKLVESAIEHFGRIDVLINNVGIWNYLEIGQIAEYHLEKTIDRLININLTSYFLVTHYTVPYMKKQGGGKIINVSSTAGQRGEAHHSHYAASKGGIIALTKSLAAELAEYNIYVNAVAPGWVNNDMSQEVLRDPDFKKQVIESIPLRKIASNEEIAGPILFLASELAGHITGEILNINGGAVLCG